MADTSCDGGISIHSPRVGRGDGGQRDVRRQHHFNPLAPGGARPDGTPTQPQRGGFQSTRPGWGEACSYVQPSHLCQISIHSPRVGRGARPTSSPWTRSTFQSTRPGWGEAALDDLRDSGAIFQSTRPGWGEAQLLRPDAHGRDFNPLAPGGARHRHEQHRSTHRHFNPLAPGGARPRRRIRR